MTTTGGLGSLINAVATPVLCNMTVRHCNVLSFQLLVCKLLQYGSDCCKPHLSMSSLNALLFYVRITIIRSYITNLSSILLWCTYFVVCVLVLLLVP